MLTVLTLQRPLLYLACTWLVGNSIIAIFYSLLQVAMLDPTPVRLEICTQFYIGLCVRVNMHSEDALSASGGSSSYSTKNVL